MGMNKIITAVFLVAVAFTAAWSAEDQNDLRLEVQRLKERVTALSNEMPALDKRSWGRGLSIGIPAGIFNEDPVAGLELSYPLSYVVSLRLDAHIILDRTYKREYYTKHLTRRTLNAILYPSIGIVGKSPMVVNVRVYGGLFAGIAHDLRPKQGVYFQARMIGGVEIYTTRHQAFFFEVGGGGTVTMRKIDYSQGIMVTGGSRFYF